MKTKILAAVVAGATVLGLAAGAAVFADDIDRQVSMVSEEVQGDLAKSDGSEADSWVRVGFGVRPAVGFRAGGWGYRPAAFGYRRAWAPGAWGWGGYRRGYWRVW